MAKRNMVLTIRLTLNTEGANWEPAFKKHARDLAKVINANPHLGTLQQFEISADGARPSRVDHLALGRPTAHLIPVFQYCKFCPNQNYCSTQGMCTVAERVRLSETLFPQVLAKQLVELRALANLSVAESVVGEALKRAMYDKYNKPEPTKRATITKKAKR